MVIRYIITTACAVAAVATMAHAQRMRPVLDLSTAATIQESCLSHARKSGQAIAIAVYDHSGELISFAKMDAASTAAAEIAKWKGKSSSTYGFSTAQTAEWNGPTAPYIATFQGGLPLFDSDGIMIGGVGVSGAPSEFDEECGRKGADAVGLLTERPS
ncbi:heme-binding protein [Parvularcula sp. LCG005]|uniref:GlcG/HbpS family heme-binding protein n=1 Tax=Parvularcula sp. LCG005 TaxID=3078805 RepID=UPI0029438549|nr:heme-binding protein [Parvularcula sp. LCG005]WOI54014.1 heme-binding protein [Parvularcula sp. LCG005]